MSETQAQRNARHQREFRARNAEGIARQRAMKRIAGGQTPRMETLAKYGIDPEDVNKIRRENGMEPIDFSLLPVTCRKPEKCVQVPREAPEIKAPDAKDVPRPSERLISSKKGGSGKGVTIASLVEKQDQGARRPTSAKAEWRCRSKGRTSFEAKSNHGERLRVKNRLYRSCDRVLG